MASDVIWLYEVRGDQCTYMAIDRAVADARRRQTAP